MATYYNNEIEIMDQLNYVKSIVSGKVIKQISSDIIEEDKDKFSHIVYEVEIEDTIKGELSNKNIKLRIVEPYDFKGESKSSQIINIDESYLLFLEKDYKPNMEKDEYVLVSNSSYKLENDNVELTPDKKNQFIKAGFLFENEDLNIKNLKKRISEYDERKNEIIESLKKEASEELKVSDTDSEESEIPINDSDGLKQGIIGKDRD